MKLHSAEVASSTGTSIPAESIAADSIRRTARRSMSASGSSAGLTDTFVQQAAQHGLYNLHGHAAEGGIRANLYNAMPQAGVRRLIAFMTAFEHAHG